MRKLPKRQVHLDFHTGEKIPGVGDAFDKAQFQAALKEGDISSITVFAKCHHGMCYYPTEIGVRHPGMRPGFDFTGAMVEAAHEIGVDAPVYITVGFSEADAKAHPEWVRKDKDGNRMGPDLSAHDPEEDLPYGSWHHLCPNGEYAELIYKETEEICRRYRDLDGLFYDIVYMGDTCYCDACMKEMRDAGQDPYDEDVNKEHYVAVHKRFARKCTEILRKYHPEATIFFNSGGAEIYRPEYHDDQSHYEMEDLPTSWGGYDKFIPRASFMSRYGKDFLGMTGKFHSDWGEFGGFKNADAMRYETAMMGMYGAACSIGDQMHPSGKMDMSTYHLIGEGYRFYHAFEPWFFHADSMAEVGVYLSGNSASDAGLHKMLLEGHIDFSVVAPGDDISMYKVLILPDVVQLPEEELERLRAFSGVIVSSGTSLVRDGRFLLPVGGEYCGASPYDVDYLCTEKLPLWVKSPFLCYTASQRIRATDGEVLADVYDPYFRRTYGHFCSHKNTPYQTEKSGYAGILRKGKYLTFAHAIFELYDRFGAQLFRDIFLSALRTLYTPMYQVELQSAGRTRLTRQPQNARYVLHMSYAQPVQRGRFSVIEDVPTLCQIPVSVRIPEKISAVRVANGEELPFTQDASGIHFTLPKLHIYTAVELDY